MSLRSDDPRDKAPVDSDDSVASVTRISPSRRSLGSKEMRVLMDRLSAQQASLARSVALMDKDYLSHSFYLDPKTGKRIAHELEPSELASFVTSWGVAPLECIRAMNAAIGAVPDTGRRDRYIKAAVELEILLDQQSWLNDGRVYQGIPDYLMHGYTDMGSQAISDGTRRSGENQSRQGPHVDTPCGMQAARRRQRR